MIADAADYFAKGCGRCERFATPECSTRQWIDGLEALRRLCLEAGLTETAKWGHPCYMHAGRNIAIIGAFRGDFRLGFFNAALMKDPEGVLRKSGPNTRHKDMIRFRGEARVRELAPVIRDYLAEAMRYAEAGLKPQDDEPELELPAELAEAIDHDPVLAEAFHALTPGRQKSYVINIGSAKAPATRQARIEKFRPKILAGKGAMER
ncbi:hypothetical protein FLX56_06370 [Synechococcus moorigangaii CMS01]|nr:hypothetical protein [Synechococcus moorigangaii CMS01]